MRKILLLLTSVMMTLGIAACGGSGEENTNTPEAAVAGFLDSVKQGDQAKVNEYVEKDDNMYSEDIAEDNEQIKMMLENITYDIQSVNADTEGISIVTVDITNVDMSAVFQTYMQNALAAAADNPDMTEEEAITLLQEAITENKENTITKTVDLEATQSEEGKWKIKTTDELGSILAGGLTEDAFQ
ncbi:hypothetical protein AAK894_03805 [Lachnospiraceae bacterium 46-61]